MIETKELLWLRKKIKAKKPKFSRQDSHKKKKLENKWRKPKGLHSKMRLGKSGYKKSVKKGYGSPRSVKNLSSEGIEKVNAFNKKDLEKIDTKSQGVIISSGVSLKKRIDIIIEAEKKKIKILNIKDLSKYIKEAEEKREKAKKEKEERKKEKEKKKKAEEKKAKKTEGKGVEEKVIDEEEKKKLEKKEKDKILTKKE